MSEEKIFEIIVATNNTHFVETLIDYKPVIIPVYSQCLLVNGEEKMFACKEQYSDSSDCLVVSSPSWTASLIEKAINEFFQNGYSKIVVRKIKLFRPIREYTRKEITEAARNGLTELK